MLRSFIAILLTLLVAPSYGRTVETIVELPITITNVHAQSYSHLVTITIFRDDSRQRAPFLVLNHGRPPQREELEKVGRERFAAQAQYFVSKGFVVFVPTRIGYGVTGGEDVENSGPCSAKDFSSAFECAAQEIVAVIQYARASPFVDSMHGLVAGVSVGGLASIAVAARNVRGVLGAVNFSGGNGGNAVDHPERPCGSDVLRRLIYTFGKSTSIPTLWLYSENDKYWGKYFPREWFRAFKESGGNGAFISLPPLMPPLGDDGHKIFGKDPAAWHPAFETFLRQIGM